LRDDWVRRLRKWKHYQLVFVESAANERTKDRKHGWAPIGERPIEHRPHKRSERWLILPAYTSRRGYITYENAFTKELYVRFLEEKVLPLCNIYDENGPLPNSVLIMDNASVHRGPEIRELFSRFGVRLEYKPPYSPDYNPIEQSFAELKAWMRKNRALADSYGDDFGAFVALAVQYMA
jgi:hypothetical protein